MRASLQEPLLLSQRPSRPHVPRMMLAAVCLLAAPAAFLVIPAVRDTQTHIFAESTIKAMDNPPANGSFVIPPACLYEVLGVTLSGTALLAATIIIVPALGFEAGGIEAESAAAAWQSTMGNVEKESLFSLLQSLAARGQLLKVLEFGLPVVGNIAVASAAFCAELDKIEDATMGAARAIANTTTAVLAEVKRAAEDAKAIEQLRDAAESAAEGATEASKQAIANASATAKEVVDAASDEARKWWEHVTNGTTFSASGASSRTMGSGLLSAGAALLSAAALQLCL